MAYSIHFYPNNNLAVVLLYDKVDDVQVTKTLKNLTRLCNERQKDTLILYDATKITELVVDMKGLESIAEQRNNLTRTGFAAKAASVTERSTDLEIARLLEHYRVLPETVHKAFSSPEKAWEHLGVEPPGDDDPFEDLTVF